jgi:hypothetical protein
MGIIFKVQIYVINVLLSAHPVLEVVANLVHRVLMERIFK